MRGGVLQPDVAATEGILLKLGVPSIAIETFGDDPRNTHQEVLALRAWAERNKTCEIIVPAEIFSARRVRWMMHRSFGSECGIRIIALNPLARNDWWHQPQAITTFGTEIIKYIYYRLIY